MCFRDIWQSRERTFPVPSSSHGVLCNRFPDPVFGDKTMGHHECILPVADLNFTFKQRDGFVE
jgi:hypothetical protein